MLDQVPTPNSLSCERAATAHSDGTVKHLSVEPCALPPPRIYRTYPGVLHQRPDFPDNRYYGAGLHTRVVVHARLPNLLYPLYRRVLSTCAS